MVGDCLWKKQTKFFEQAKNGESRGKNDKLERVCGLCFIGTSPSLTSGPFILNTTRCIVIVLGYSSDSNTFPKASPPACTFQLAYHYNTSFEFWSKIFSQWNGMWWSQWGVAQTLSTLIIHCLCRCWLVISAKEIL